MDRKLITDAVSTANKCGLLPSELLSQRNELLEACKNLIKLHYPNYELTDSSLHPANMAIKAINKINNGNKQIRTRAGISKNCQN